MKSSGLLPVAALALAAFAGPLRAQGTTAAQEPIEIAQLPYMEIFSPTFFWNDRTDAIHTGAITCPKGRAITGGLNIVQGSASLRVVESYPDGESWVVRAVNRQKKDAVHSLQVRGFALCMLPAARKASVLMVQHPRLTYESTKFLVPTGYESAAARQACPQGSLVVSGGFGIDPGYRGPSNPRVELSYPDPNGWNVRAVNGEQGPGPPAEARAYAVCLGAKGGINVGDSKAIYFASADVVAKYDQGVARQSVSCGDRDAHVLAGGVRSIRGRSASIELQESYPNSPSSWTVAVTNRGDRKAGNVTVRIYAICIKT